MRGTGGREAGVGWDGERQTGAELVSQVEHGGFIAAETLGLYDAEKLDVELVPGGPGAPQLVITELAAERIAIYAAGD